MIRKGGKGGEKKRERASETGEERKKGENQGKRKGGGKQKEGENKETEGGKLERGEKKRCGGGKEQNRGGEKKSTLRQRKWNLTVWGDL